MTNYKACHLYNLGADTWDRLETATDVIDFVGREVAEMVVMLLIDKHGVTVTEEQFNTAFARTFDAALPEFLRRLDRVDPTLAAKVRRQFVAEYEAELELSTQS